MTPTEINNCSVLYDEDITVHFVVIFIIFFSESRIPKDCSYSHELFQFGKLERNAMNVIILHGHSEIISRNK